MGLGNGKDSDAHSINLHAMSDLLQNKQKVYMLSSSLQLRRVKWKREESHPDRSGQTEGHKDAQPASQRVKNAAALKLQVCISTARA